MQPSSAAYVDLEQLSALREQARGLPLHARQVAASVLAGRHETRLRGRGLSFEELRPYWPGDDARLIDWKVTARLGRPFLRLYSEERDQPVLLLIDQRMNQFFGSRHTTKSVLAAHTAALFGWAALERHDRVGALLFNDDSIEALRPARGHRAFMHLLGRLCELNQQLHARHPGDGPHMLNAVLERARRLAGKDHLLILISDFNGLNAETHDLLSALQRHNDLLLCWTQDPLLIELPSGGELVASDGDLQMRLNLDSSSQRQTLQRLHQLRLQQILEWPQGIGIGVLPLSAAQPAAQQLHALLGGGHG
ncbi:DUF58 domain-containing protein [Halopseudomonas maritima]|uniref:DUF58 domain-containing protein n=1 Tax=Halopseudomonas maritima TaxID=2918528 RepID=UPI001EE9C75E|nr:DUF58 domain-containing protein [Halopseudomonas maritima]UJJ33085.1 DUF58 domain-containing protein [Halopseudomonas maritima]